MYNNEAQVAWEASECAALPLPDGSELPLPLPFAAFQEAFQEVSGSFRCSQRWGCEGS